MKSVKNLALAVMFALCLAVSAPAGEVPMPGAASPTPSPSPQGAESFDGAKSANYSDAVAVNATAETSDYLLYEALAALLSVY